MTYFHGTYADLEPGTILRPGAEIGRATWDYSNPKIAGDERHVWVTTCIENAICDVGGAREGLFYVYEVRPAAVDQPDPGCPNFTCAAAEVVKRVMAVTADGDVIEEPSTQLTPGGG